MNILVRTADGSVYTRPDTSWNRKSDDYFVPECVSGLSWAPAVFIHISRPGKCIGTRFAPRYYDGANFGMLLYAEPMLVSGPAGFAASACFDHTSLLSENLLEAAGLAGKTFVVRKDGVVVFESAACDISAMNEALSAASNSCLVRHGDLLCQELAPPQHLCSRTGGTVRISSETLLDFRIVFA